ncbi:hypothetical protein CERSUDRAFT_114784 [Gelatoporia subvermispora B]|uniref:Uncharacterized protein n=1 Tax=Ceriporiopsis subvermispora (strain B) TaxID=914234 RepID=M2QIK5_CERS8|nr:hypothetical protein CERSUDRAFT_114784 [Gelatoporia subvermispora B]
MMRSIPAPASHTPCPPPAVTRHPQGRAPDTRDQGPMQQRDTLRATTARRQQIDTTLPRSGRGCAGCQPLRASRATTRRAGGSLQQASCRAACWGSAPWQRSSVTMFLGQQR